MFIIGNDIFTCFLLYAKETSVEGCCIHAVCTVINALTCSRITSKQKQANDSELERLIKPRLSKTGRVSWNSSFRIPKTVNFAFNLSITIQIRFLNALIGKFQSKKEWNAFLFHLFHSFLRKKGVNYREKAWNFQGVDSRTSNYLINAIMSNIIELIIECSKVVESLGYIYHNIFTLIRY